MSTEPPTALGGDIVVYVELLDEGVDVQRPVLAKREGEVYRLPSEAPKGESWSLPPGSLVRCERRDGDLYAVEAL